MKKTALLFALGAALPAMASAATIAITNAEIHTEGRGGIIPKGTVLIRDQRIDAVGADVPVPPDARVIDAQGKPVTPGLFDAYTNVGLKEIDGVDESNDTAVSRPRYSAALDVTDAFNPRSTLIPVNRIEGLTRAVTAPESGSGGSFIAGQGAVVSLGSLSEWLVKPKAAMFAQLGETGASLSGGSRTAAWAALREAFDEVRQAGMPRTNPEHQSQLTRLDIEALRPVLSGEEPLELYLNRASDILAALKLADDSNVRLIVRGGAEAWMVAPQLAEHQVPVLIDPREDLPQRFETLAARADSAALLQKSGVLIAIVLDDDFSTHNARNIRQLAGNAAAHGLDKEAALAAITINPARIYGVDGTLGSIEAGKAADLVLWDGDPLETTSFPKAVYINGAEVPMTSRQTELRDRYMQRLKLGVYAKQ
jgi:imidazolonepropionase-like amidohydrolase